MTERDPRYLGAAVFNSCPYLVGILDSEDTPVVITKGVSLGYSSTIEAELYKFLDSPPESANA